MSHLIHDVLYLQVHTVTTSHICILWVCFVPISMCWCRNSKQQTCHCGLQCTYTKMLFCCIALYGHCALCSVISRRNLQGIANHFFHYYLFPFCGFRYQTGTMSQCGTHSFNLCTLESYTAVNTQTFWESNRARCLDLSDFIYLVRNGIIYKVFVQPKPLHHISRSLGYKVWKCPLFFPRW